MYASGLALRRLLLHKLFEAPISCLLFFVLVRTHLLPHPPPGDELEGPSLTSPTTSLAFLPTPPPIMSDNGLEKETVQHLDTQGSSTSDHESGLDPQYESEIMYVLLRPGDRSRDLTYFSVANC